MRLIRTTIGLSLAGLMLVGTVSESTARTARRIYAEGHGYGYRGHYRTYRRGPDVGPAVAGAALGIIGLAAGAAAANAYGDDGYGYGHSYGYAPRYGYAPGYGYAPSYGYAPYGYGEGYPD